MSARAFRRAAALALLASAAAAGAALAQDVRVLAERAGRRLPPTYEQRLLRDPAAFEIRHGWTRAPERAARVNGVVRGSLPLVVVQALFADSPEPAFTTQQVSNVLFSGPAPYGTLRALYEEMSGGRFTVAGEVLPWVRTSLPRAQAGDFHVVAFLEALRQVDANTDFGRFDNDGPDGVPNSGDDDGIVDAVAFHYLEPAASCGGPGIWPHRSGLAGWQLPDGSASEVFRTNDPRPNGQPVIVDDYITQSTVTCGGQLLTSSTIAHELGHILGLPDLYHAVGGILPQFRRWVVGCWSLMAAGAWGCGNGGSFVDGLRPPHMGPWEKSLMGWTQEQVVGDVVNTEFTLQPVAAGGQVLRVPIRPNEYFLIEYRPRTGFDQDLVNGGVLIHHVDRNTAFFPCAGCPRVYQVSLVEADGNGALLRTAAEGGNRGEAGDVWGVGSRTRFNATTTPAARGHNGVVTAIAIHDITLSGGSARIRLSTVFRREGLLKTLLNGGGDDLTAEEKTYLDATGNQNGRYDIGDFRKYLLAHPAAGQES